MHRPGFAVVAVLVFALVAPAQPPITRADLKPGLLFTQSDAVEGATGFTAVRTEPTVALTLDSGEAAHPRSSGGTTFRWQGHINILQPGKYTFAANLTGDLAVKISGKDVLTGQIRDGAKMLPPNVVELVAGIQPFEAVLVRTGPTARVELLWSGAQFRLEPIPYFFFGHLPKERPGQFAMNQASEHGRFLFEELSCVKCHQPEAANKTLVERTGPNLTEIGKRAYPGWLDAWLADPQSLRPHTVMPKMFDTTEAGKAERYAVVAYLASLGGPIVEAKQPTVNQQYQKSISDGGKLFLTAGCAACHGDKLTQPPTKKKKDDEDEKPELLPEDSFYALGTAGPVGIYQLGAVGSKWTPDALTKYLQNPLTTNPHGRMPNMMLSGQEAQDLARFLCRQTDDKLSKPLPNEPKMKPETLVDAGDAAAIAKLAPADQWKEVGKKLLTSKGCVNCHAVEAGGKSLPMKTASGLAALMKSPETGCVSAAANVAKVPVYALTATQKAALAAFLKTGLGSTPSPVYQARVAVRRFNCLACHNRDGEGGFSPELADQMRLLEKAENADELNPPRLTGAGHKLRTSWMTQVLTQAGRARPWMTLRMPQYGEANVGFLAHGLPKLEGTTPDDSVGKANLSAANVEAGRLLTGKSGHGCIACHDISGVSGGGTRGPDLALTQNRVRYDWYTRWMHQPQRIAPGTKMPQYIINGKALLTTVFDGDGDKQIEALWAYLALGPGLPLPSGMEPPKGLVVSATERPTLLRTFMPDNAGTKCIAVAYPGGTNVVFDAAQCRIGYAWSGNFLDASPVWNNRGGAPAKLLGPKFWTGPAGFPWAVTDGTSPPDFAKRATDPAFGFQLPEDRAYTGPRNVHFAGYGLDTAGVPTFRYTLTDETGKTTLAVSERIDPLPVTVAAGIRRTLVLDLPAEKTSWLLLDTPSEIPRITESRIVIPSGGKATVIDLVTAPPGTVLTALLPAGNGKRQILLRIPGAAMPTKAELVLHVWGLPRDDEALLKGLKAK